MPIRTGRLKISRHFWRDFPFNWVQQLRLDKVQQRGWAPVQWWTSMPWISLSYLCLCP